MYSKFSVRSLRSSRLLCHISRYPSDNLKSHKPVTSTREDGEMVSRTATRRWQTSRAYHFRALPPSARRMSKTHVKLWYKPDSFRSRNSSVDTRGSEIQAAYVPSLWTKRTEVRTLPSVGSKVKKVFSAPFSSSFCSSCHPGPVILLRSAYSRSFLRRRRFPLLIYSTKKTTRKLCGS